MSDEKPFRKPRLTINRVYTRGGDQGETGLAGGQRVPKDSARIEAYGAVDELNAVVGLAAQTARELEAGHPSLAELVAILRRVQHELFNLGSILATLPEDVGPQQPRITDGEVARLESEIDRMNEGLPPLRSFVLPGGCRLNAELHLSRTVCRRVERLCVTLARSESVPPEAVRYLNRLGDAFFVWSRWASRLPALPSRSGIRTRRLRSVRRKIGSTASGIGLSASTRSRARPPELVHEQRLDPLREMEVGVSLPPEAAHQRRGERLSTPSNRHRPRRAPPRSDGSRGGPGRAGSASPGGVCRTRSTAGIRCGRGSRPFPTRCVTLAGSPRRPSGRAARWAGWSPAPREGPREARAR